LLPGFMTTSMKIERDWVDYAKLASSLTQNLQLDRINSQLEEMRAEQRRGNNLIASVERIRQLEAERKKALRNSLWQATQALESIKKDYAENPFTLTFALRALTPQISADEFDEWEDKQRLKSFCDELASLKDQTKSKLGEAQFDDAMKCCDAFDQLKDLNRFILMERLKSAYEKTLERFKREAANLEGGHRGRKELELKAHEEVGKFGGLMDSLTPDDIKRLIATMGPEAETRYVKSHQDLAQIEDKKKMAELGAVLDKADAQLALEAEHLLLLQQFNMNHEEALKYRQGLLEAVMRCFKLDSLQAAEAQIVGEHYRLDFMEAHAKAEAVKRAKSKEDQEEKKLRKNAKGCLGCSSILLCFFGWGAIHFILGATGFVENTQRTENVQPAIFFSICSLVLILAIVVAGLLLTAIRKHGDKPPVIPN
jgi:hypothetical protein